MKELIEFIVKALVEKPGEVNITQTEVEGMAVIEIRVAPEDAGKVIGKEGRIANALRTIVKAAGANQRQRVTVEILTGDEESRVRNKF